MTRFLIRNYGASRHLHHKGKITLIVSDGAIETDDVDFIASISHEKKLHIIDRGPEYGGRVTPEPKPELVQLDGNGESIVDNPEAIYQENHPESVEDEDVCKDSKNSELGSSEVEDSENQEQEEIEDYDDLTVVELKVIAKDRSIETKGLLKAEIVEALEKYDSEEVEDVVDDE